MKLLALIVASIAVAAFIAVGWFPLLGVVDDVMRPDDKYVRAFFAAVLAVSWVGLGSLVVESIAHGGRSERD